MDIYLCWWQDGMPTCLARPWTPKQPKLAQPDLDYIAPEIQLETSKIATVGCDVFSLGLLVCSVYNSGRSLVQASYNPAVYMRHIDRVRHIKVSLNCIRASFIISAADSRNCGRETNSHDAGKLGENATLAFSDAFEMC